jgi:histidinol-phosphate/aromatic aminotransferase/cobyric acid decarboxylase-like protein
MLRRLHAKTPRTLVMWGMGVVAAGIAAATLMNDGERGDRGADKRRRAHQEYLATQPRLDSRAVALLPPRDEPYALLDLCNRTSNEQQHRRLRRQGYSLARIVQSEPNSVVRITYSTTDVQTGNRSVLMTVRELARDQLDVLGPQGDCEPDLQRSLRRATE